MIDAETTRIRYRRQLPMRFASRAAYRIDNDTR